MCKTALTLTQVFTCTVQMLVRVFMTIVLMLENLARMLLQTFYNFISFLLQICSLIPICIVFLLTARLKCFMCGGGGPCPVARGGTCDCVMSAVALIILYFIFRATGTLDRIFYHIGYAKAVYETVPPPVGPTPSNITECSRDTTEIDVNATTFIFEELITQRSVTLVETTYTTDTTDTSTEYDLNGTSDYISTVSKGRRRFYLDSPGPGYNSSEKTSEGKNETVVFYYLL